MSPYVVALLAGVSLLLPGQVSEQPRPITPELRSRANLLSADEAANIEAQLKVYPDDLDSRVRLIGYYRRVDGGTREARAAAAQHLLWIIEHRPRAPIIGRPDAYLMPFVDEAAFSQARRLWNQHIERHPDDLALLRNAAGFFQLSDPPLAEEIIRKAAAIDPSNPEWPFQLGQLYGHRVLDLEGGADKAMAQKALAAFEEALAMPNGVFRSLVLKQAAKAAVAAGEFGKAKLFAVELMELRVSSPFFADVGGATHHGNLILGHVALHEGDVDAAERFLLLAGQTAGSPALMSFGPNMLLAKRLLEKGSSKIVLEYLESCRKFWKLDGGKLDQWTADIKGGRVPDFGANLRY